MDLTHKASDIKIKYKANNYKNLEAALQFPRTDAKKLWMILSLLGYSTGKRVPLDMEDKSGEHTFSRVVYNGANLEMDANMGLISILHYNYLPYETVINKIAFEKMTDNRKQYAKLDRVRVFYEYLLQGIGEAESIFFDYGKSEVDIVDSIHKFLSQDINIDLERIADIIAELEVE